MAQKDLIPLNKRTKEERKKIAQKGGKASGEARRAKKTMREYAEFLLSLEVHDGRKFNKLTRAGVPTEGCDNKMLVVFGLMQAAQAGDVAAVKELRSIIGEMELPAKSAEDEAAIQQEVKNAIAKAVQHGD